MRRLLPYGLLLALAACGQLLSETGDDEQPGGGPGPDADGGGGGGPGSDGGSTGDGASSPSDGSSQQDTGVPCTSATTSLTADEDTVGLECAASITYGDSQFLNVGLTNGATGFRSMMFAKFSIPTPLKLAFDQGRVTTVRLVLAEDTSQGVNKSGALAAHVLRNDWVAGASSAGYAGADLCRRSAGNPGLAWGNGAGAPPSTSTHITQDIDYGPSVGAQAYAAADTQVTLQLAVNELFTDWKTRRALSNDLSLMVEDIQAGSFVIASTNSTSFPKPTLAITVCQ